MTIHELEPVAGSLALSALMAVAAGLIGSFAVMRRMVLAADPMSHIALPGIGIALILHLNPLWGALALLLLGAVLIWAVERRIRIATEAVIGVTFAVALAVGSIITSGEELLDALLGAPGMLTLREAAFGVIGSLIVIVFVLRERNALVVRLVSPEIALTSAVDVARLDLYFLLAFALTIGLGLRFLGVLLMGSLIIIPAAIARRFARSLDTMLGLSVAVAVVATAAGTYVASLAGRQSGHSSSWSPADCSFFPCSSGAKPDFVVVGLPLYLIPGLAISVAQGVHVGTVAFLDDRGDGYDLVELGDPSLPACAGHRGALAAR